METIFILLAGITSGLLILKQIKSNKTCNGNCLHCKSGHLPTSPSCSSPEETDRFPLPFKRKIHLEYKNTLRR